MVWSVEFGLGQPVQLDDRQWKTSSDILLIMVGGDLNDIYVKSPGVGQSVQE